MSGGAFDYFYLSDSSDVFENLDALEKMIDFLRSHNKDDAAEEVERLHLDLRMFQRMIDNRLKRLQEVLREAEWWASGDSNEEYFDEVWNEFLRGRK